MYTQRLRTHNNYTHLLELNAECVAIDVCGDDVTQQIQIDFVANHGTHLQQQRMQRVQPII